MQVSSVRPTPAPPQYNPFTLQLKVESKSDVEKLYFLFNYAPLVAALGMSVTADAIRAILAEHDTSHGFEFSNYRRILETNISKVSK